MKNKIKQFAKGNFKLEQPDIYFSETQIHISVGEGETYQGSFTILNKKDGNIRGLVYPSSFRVHCVEQGFEGNPVQVNFTYDSAGLRPGHIEKGKFTVVCNGGEYELDFTAVIEKPFIETSVGKVQTIADFKQLAMHDFWEAKKVFRTKKFYDILKYEENRIRNLYTNMRKWSLDEQGLEEFLVGIKQKEKIFLTLSEEELEFEYLLEDKKGTIELEKNTWGYVPIQIICEGDFLEVRKKEISTEDFVGNFYELEYVIRAAKLHAGKNYGKLYIKTPYETLEIPVLVQQQAAKKDDFGMTGMIAGQLWKEYFACVAGKMPLLSWGEKAQEHVSQLREMEPENTEYQLLQAHIYLRCRQEEEAGWLLENVNVNKGIFGKHYELQAYYLFLMALWKKDTLYTNQVVEELNRVYQKYPKSWRLLCMLVNLDTKYRDYADRIELLEKAITEGANQVLLLSEAYICFQERVLLLRKLDTFEIRIMNFAAKYQLMTRELALHLADLVIRQRHYDKRLVKIMEKAYDMYEEPKILNAICMQLIKGNKAGSAYLKWYQKAVEQEMKIAQLYEFFLMSVNPKRVQGAFPKIVYLYFLHGIQLDYKRTALLYENIILYEEEHPEIYRQYRDQMKRFAMSELRKRHINDSLRVLYNRFIDVDTVTLEDVDALYDICHAYRVTTTNKEMKYVLVIEKDGTIVQRVAYHPGKGARVYLYDKDARIVWEGNNGLHFADSIPYETRRLFYELHFLEVCKRRENFQLEMDKAKEIPALTIENLQQYGLEPFDTEEVFLFYAKLIRDFEQAEDDFLIYVGLELVKAGFYDKAILSYLTRYYCGATKDMKFVWKKAQEHEVNTKALAERIITQMIFSEVMFQEEEIFEDYYNGKPYFRLKQAYLSYIARNYVVYGRVVSEKLIQIMQQELCKKESLADICKVAILKFYAGKTVTEKQLQFLKESLCEMCEKHLVFPFYMKYPEEWLREVQLFDKVLISYQSNMDGEVKMTSQIQREDDSISPKCTESLLPIYETIYVKEVVLYEGEVLTYSFKESKDEEEIITEVMTCEKQHATEEIGKYGRLNQMMHLPKGKQYEAMLSYKQEEVLAEEIFPIY